MSLRISLKKLNKLSKGSKNTVGSKFANVLLKYGKKGHASRMFEYIFFYACVHLKKTYPYLLKKFLKKMVYPFEMKVRVKGKRIIPFPFFVKRRRSKYLAVKSIVTDVKKDKVLNNLTLRLCYEVLRVFTDQPSKTTENLATLKREVNRHRAYAHYRW